MNPLNLKTIKTILLSLITCWVVSFASAIDVARTVQTLGGDDYAARLDARLDLLQAFAEATNPGVADDPVLALEASVIGQLNAEGLPLTGRLYLIRMLELFGSDAGADAAYALLGDSDPQVRDSACRALVAIPGAKAEAYLLTALSKGPKAGRAVYIDALATRGAGDAAPTIAEYLQASDPALQEAAALALGKLGNGAVVPALLSARHAATGREKVLIDVALLQIGENRDTAYRLAPADAYSVYQTLLNDPINFQIWQAALIGLSRVDPVQGESLVLRYLSEADAAMNQAAIAASVFISSEELTVKMGALAAAESTPNTNGLIQTLASRGDAQVIPVLEGLLATPSTQVEAINMLGAVGSVAQVPVLTGLLFDADPGVAKAAEGALIDLRAEGVDEAIAQSLLNGTSDQQVAFLKVADGRRTLILAATAAKLMSSDNAAVANAALKVVVLSGSAAELKGLCALALEQPKNSKINSGIVKLGERLYDDDAVAAILIDSADRATPEGQLAFIKMLRKFPTASAETYLLSQLQTGSPELQLAVVQALSDFSSVESTDALLRMSKEGRTAAVKDAASQAIEDMRNNIEWTFSSNFNNHPTEHQRMIDLNPKSRWTSKAMMASSEPMWIVVDLGFEQAFNSVLLDTTASAGDYPRAYALYVSNDSNDFGEPIASGKGTALTSISCDAVGRYVKIVQTAREGPYWSVHELKINGRPSMPKAE